MVPTLPATSWPGLKIKEPVSKPSKEATRVAPEIELHQNLQKAHSAWSLLMAKLDPQAFPESDTVWALQTGPPGAACVRPALVRLRGVEGVGRGSEEKKEGERERRREGRERKEKTRATRRREGGECCVKMGFWRTGEVA